MTILQREFSRDPSLSRQRRFPGTSARFPTSSVQSRTSYYSSFSVQSESNFSVKLENSSSNQRAAPSSTQRVNLSYNERAALPSNQRTAPPVRGQLFQDLLALWGHHLVPTTLRLHLSQGCRLKTSVNSGWSVYIWSS